MKNAANRREEILSLCFLPPPPEIPPPAPLQTQDGSAVATVKRTLVGFWCFGSLFLYLLGPVAADCAETFVIYAKTIQQAPDDKSTPASNIGMEGGGAKAAKIGKRQHRRRNTGAFLGTETFFCPIRPRYVNKKRKTKERKHIFILLYRRDTRNQDTTGALFTRYGGSHVFTSVTRFRR